MATRKTAESKTKPADKKAEGTKPPEDVTPPEADVTAAPPEDDTTEPAEGQGDVLSADHGRTFHASPIGAIFAFRFEDGTGLKVWQYPPITSRKAPAVLESADATVQRWRIRRVAAEGASQPAQGNPDRTYSTAQVNELLDQLATASLPSDD